MHLLGYITYFYKLCDFNIITQYFLTAEAKHTKKLEILTLKNLVFRKQIMEMKCITGYIYLLYILSVTCDPCPYIYTNTQLETPYIIDTHGLTQYTPGVALNSEFSLNFKYESLISKNKLYMYISCIVTIYSTESFQKATFQVIDVTSSLSVGSLSAADPIKTIRCSNNGKADFPDYNNYINLIWTPPSAYKSSVKIR